MHSMPLHMMPAGSKRPQLPLGAHGTGPRKPERGPSASQAQQRSPNYNYNLGGRLSFNHDADAWPLRTRRPGARGEQCQRYEVGCDGSDAVEPPGPLRAADLNAHNLRSVVEPTAAHCRHLLQNRSCRCAAPQTGAASSPLLPRRTRGSNAPAERRVPRRPCDALDRLPVDDTHPLHTSSAPYVVPETGGERERPGRLREPRRAVVATTHPAFCSPPVW